MVDIPWDDLKLFLAVAESGSVSSAARRLRLGQPTVSRRLQALEHMVGARLFLRSVAGTALTATGERLLGPARRMAELAGEAGRAAEARDHAPRGLVRITSTPLISFEFLAPFAAHIKRRRHHSGLRLEVISTMQYLDLSRGEAELAIRLRPPEHEELDVVASVALPSAAFVTQGLKAQLPRRPQLSDVPWIAWAPPFDMLPPNPLLQKRIPGFVPAFSSDNILVNLAAAEAGLGAIILGRTRSRLSRPRQLVPLELELGPEARVHLYLVCARSALAIARVRAVADLLVAEMTQLERE
jgi:DNA-binding transcriptional LysR family regulator